MKRQQLGEIKQLEVKVLLVKVKMAKAELTDLILDKNMKKLKDVKVILKKRRDIAQILTVIKQKQLLVELEPVIASVAKQSSQDKQSSAMNKTPIKIATLRQAQGKLSRNDKKVSKQNGR